MREKKAVLLYSQALCQQFIQNVKHCWNKGIRCSKFYLDDLKTVEKVRDTTDQQPDRLLTPEYPPPPKPYFISWRYKNYSLDRPKNARYPHSETTTFSGLSLKLCCLPINYVFVITLICDLLHEPLLIVYEGHVQFHLYP